MSANNSENDNESQDSVVEMTNEISTADTDRLREMIDIIEDKITFASRDMNGADTDDEREAFRTLLANLLSVKNRMQTRLRELDPNYDPADTDSDVTIPDDN